MSQVIFVLLFVAVLGAIVFYGLVFPVWMIVHSATSDRLTKLARGVWIVVILILGVIGAGLYAVFASGRRALQWTGGIGVFGGLIAAVGLLVGMFFLKDAIPQEIAKTAALLNRAELVSLVEEDRQDLSVALRTLRDEFQGARIISEKGLVTFRLVELLELMLRDGALTQAEHDEWLQAFESRELLSADALEDRVRSLRGRR
jgi:hypothetical protein